MSLCKYLAVFVFLQFSPLIVFANQEKECREVAQCREDFILNECADFAKDEKMRAKLTACSIDDAKKSYTQNLGDITKACGSSVSTAVSEFISHVGSIPEHLRDNVNKHHEQNGIAYAICTQRLGYDTSQAHKERYLRPDGEARLRTYNICYQSEVNKLRNYQFPNIPNAEQVKKAAIDLERMRRCFKAEAQAEALCPALASLLGGGAIGFVAKRAIMAKGASSTVTAAQTAGRIEDDLAEIERRAGSTKEKKSAKHQKDLIDAADSQWGKEFIKNNNLDETQLKKGMLDSDKGKLASYWQSSVLTPGRSSDELLDVLKGKGSTPAGRAMQEIFNEAGMKGKSFLNPNMSNDQLREVLKSNPALQGYLHEMPGMGDAVAELNRGAITAEQFKLRMKANLFHNGPNEGYWKFLNDELVPGSLNKPGAQEFFRGTVFESEKLPNGVIKPVYPGPISPEGVFHTVSDRMSQGTRGGMSKIISELGGEPLHKNPSMKLNEIKNFKGEAWGFDKYKEMFFNNPNGTLAQMKALEDHVAKMKASGQLTAQQANGFKAMTVRAQERLQQEISFISQNTRKLPNGDLELRWTDAYGNPRKKVITPNTPTDEALRSLDEFMLAEERLHGDPIKDLMSPRRLGGVVAGSAVGGGLLATVPNYCQKYQLTPRENLPPKGLMELEIGAGVQ